MRFCARVRVGVGVYMYSLLHTSIFFSQPSKLLPRMWFTFTNPQLSNSKYIFMCLFFPFPVVYAVAGETVEICQVDTGNGVDLFRPIYLGCYATMARH